jgi:hypothetical protein
MTWIFLGKLVAGDGFFQAPQAAMHKDTPRANASLSRAGMIPKGREGMFHTTTGTPLGVGAIAGYYSTFGRPSAT